MGTAVPELDRDVFPHIVEAALSIAYDNGMINRHTSESVFLDAVLELMSFWNTDFLTSADAFLGALSGQEFEDLTTGEYYDQEMVLNKFHNPTRLDDLLTAIFEIDA